MVCGPNIKPKEVYSFLEPNRYKNNEKDQNSQTNYKENRRNTIDMLLRELWLIYKEYRDRGNSRANSNISKRGYQTKPN